MVNSSLYNLFYKGRQNGGSKIKSTFTPFLISNAHFIDIIIMKNKIYFIL